ncbi:MAG: protease modulator HflK, partial [Planctomycetaceae bacterium]
GCLLAAWWLTRHLVLLQPDERALVQRLGRHHETLGPGLWWRWPPPFETLRRERPDRLQTLAFGFRSAPRPVTTPGEYRAPVEWQTTHEDQGYLMLPDEALLLTGDELLVELTAEAQWQISDLREYAAQSADPVAILRGLVESAIREVVARKSLEELLGAGRRHWEADCLEAARGALDRHQLGLRLVTLNLLEVHPPGGVVPSYRDVANALEEREQLLNLGQTQAARTLLATAGEPALAAFPPASRTDPQGDPVEEEAWEETREEPPLTPGANPGESAPAGAAENAGEAATSRPSPTVNPPRGRGRATTAAPRVPDDLWRTLSADLPSDLQPRGDLGPGTATGGLDSASSVGGNPGEAVVAGAGAP